MITQLVHVKTSQWFGLVPTLLTMHYTDKSSIKQCSLLEMLLGVIS